MATAGVSAMYRICLVVTSFAAVAACSSKPDCERYAKRTAELGTAGLHGEELDSRLKTVEFSAREACNSGEVTTKVASCVIAASSRDEALRCEGLGGAASTPEVKAPPPPPPAGKRLRRTGFSARLPVGWTEANNTTDSEALLRGEGVDGVMILRVNGTPKGVASGDSCRAASAKFSARTGAIMESADLVDARLGKDCRAGYHDSKMKFETHAFAVGSSETLVVNCYYDLTKEAAPSFCGDVLGSIAVD